MTSRKDDALIEWLAWSAALAIAAAALFLVRFVSKDPDSTAYAGISAHLSALPIHDWLAPEWSGVWGFQGPFREHPVGIFLLPALLGKLGFPALQAGYVIGACFSIVAILLIRGVAGFVVGKHEATAVQWAALILPIAFVYRVRASQEYPVLVLLLLALYATEKSRTSPAWIAVSVFAACAIALVKGIFVVFMPVVCGLWLVCMRESGHHNLRAWMGLAVAMGAVLVFAVLYETLYRRMTGTSFIDYYLVHRLGENMGVEAGPPSISRKLYNVVWYGARLLWFGVPGTLALIVAGLRSRKSEGLRVPRREMQGLYFALCVAAVYVLAMSLGANKADRFIFPAYFVVGVCGTIVAIRRWERVDHFARWLDSLKPYVLPLVWLVLVLAVVFSEQHLPYLKFWTS